MGRPDTAYWQGVRARLLPALLVGAVVVAVGWLLFDLGSALLCGLASFLSAALMPTRPSRRDQP